MEVASMRSMIQKQGSASGAPAGRFQNEKGKLDLSMLVLISLFLKCKQCLNCQEAGCYKQFFNLNSTHRCKYVVGGGTPGDSFFNESLMFCSSVPEK
jgi:hypothetical protein